MPDWISVILLGIIEGITEFLPVSSTGHLLLAEQWLGKQSELFNIVIQCGAVLAVLPLFPQRLRQFVSRWRDSATRDYLLKILAAFALTGLGGVLLDRQGFKLQDKMLPVAAALFVGGILFLVIEKGLQGRPRHETVTWTIAIAVGIGQLIAAVFPGTSRSGATILMALLLGLNRVVAVEFTFLVGIPTMLAAGALKIAKELRTLPSEKGEDWGLLLLGFAVAAATSFIAVKWLLGYVQTHTFVLFGWYRIGLALVIGVVLLSLK
jgi:undecaprenyl-diphosphatase